MQKWFLKLEKMNKANTIPPPRPRQRNHIPSNHQEPHSQIADFAAIYSTLANIINPVCPMIPSDLLHSSFTPVEQEILILLIRNLEYNTSNEARRNEIINSYIAKRFL